MFNRPHDYTASLIIEIEDSSRLLSIPLLTHLAYRLLSVSNHFPFQSLPSLVELVYFSNAHNSPVSRECDTELRRIVKLVEIIYEKLARSHSLIAAAHRKCRRFTSADTAQHFTKSQYTDYCRQHAVVLWHTLKFLLIEERYMYIFCFTNFTSV